MDVLSIVHGEDAGTELFAPLVAEAGHRLPRFVDDRRVHFHEVDARRELSVSKRGCKQW